MAQQWTVHDEYAARAMQAILSNEPPPYLSNRAQSLSQDTENYVARIAGRFADAMLAERRRGSGKELANDIAEALSLPKRDYTDARGAVVPPAGAPSPEDAIRAGRGDLPAHEGEF